MGSLSTLNDSELLALLSEGDHAAFDRIYRDHWEPLYRSAYNVLRDSDAADDIVQEIFVWLWANREKHLTDRLRPYLQAAVKYQIANLVRHGKVKEAFYARTVLSYQEAEVTDSYEVSELKQIIAAFTQTLPDRAREVFRLSREEHLTNKEIAERLGISEKTVENQMTINLKKLRLTLGKMSFWSVLL